MKRAVIVGNSDGIGLALTRRLLDAGWTVTGLSRSAGGLRHERYSHQVIDVTAAGYTQALADCLDATDGVDLCVYAAGVGEFVDVHDLASQTRTIEVNLIGAARTLEVVVPAMVTAGTGHIVGLSSLADAAPSGQAPAYAASKAGMTTYLMGLARTLRPHGVTVTTVRLGFVDTKMAKASATPGMISVGMAVDILMDVLHTRPTVVSRPRHIAAAAGLLGLLAATRARIHRRRPR